MGYCPSTRGEHMVMVPYVTNSMESMAGRCSEGSSIRARDPGGRVAGRGRGVRSRDEVGSGALIEGLWTALRTCCAPSVTTCRVTWAIAYDTGYHGDPIMYPLALRGEGWGHMEPQMGSYGGRLELQEVWGSRDRGIGESFWGLDPVARGREG